MVGNWSIRWRKLQTKIISDPSGASVEVDLLRRKSVRGGMAQPVHYDMMAAVYRAGERLFEVQGWATVIDDVIRLEHRIWTDVQRRAENDDWEQGGSYSLSPG